MEETLDTDIGERVLYHLADDIIGYGRDIAARTRRLSNMNGIADRRGNYLRINTLYHENISYLADKLHSAFANVVKPSEERRYISCSRIGGEYSLSRREDQRYVGLDTLCGKALAGFQMPSR